MVDERDKIIINTLRKNAKISIRELAKKTNLPQSTIHRRLKILEREGVIKGYRLVLNWEKIGRPIGILVFIDVIPEKRPLQKPFIPLKKVEEELEKFEEVEEVLLTEGEKDIMVKARLKNLQEVREFLDKIRNIPGVTELESCIIIEETIK
jgi:Lrp/AsnC family transcriptional regulator for asnA, asnC and gidA